MWTAWLLDPPILSDGKTPTFENWLMAMKVKMMGNVDHYNTPTLWMGYVCSRTSDQALSHLAPRSQENAVMPFTNSTEMMDLLDTIFGDLN